MLLPLFHTKDAECAQKHSTDRSYCFLFFSQCPCCSPLKTKNPPPRLLLHLHPTSLLSPPPNRSIFPCTRAFARRPSATRTSCNMLPPSWTASAPVSPAPPL